MLLFLFILQSVVAVLLVLVCASVLVKAQQGCSLSIQFDNSKK